MEKANVHSTTQRPKVAVILRGVAGSGKSTEASKILELAQSEGLVASSHATNDRWLSKRNCPHLCNCGVQMVLQDSQKKLYACQHGEKGCRSIGRAEEVIDGCMYLYIPSLALEAELDNLSAFMKDLESGHDVVVAENVFLHEMELYPYACAARLANYVTYVVDMQGVDAQTADANASRAHHVYSLHEGNRAVIERQIAQWRPVNPAALPKHCKMVQCPYGKSKAHIVLAPIFTFEECQKEAMAIASQREPVLGGQLGQGSSAQTLALGWRPQHSGAHAAPDGTSPPAAGIPNGSSGDMHNAGASACQPGPSAQVGEVSSPATAPNAAGAQQDEQPQEQVPSQGPAPPAKEQAVEKQSGIDGHGQHEAAPTSMPVKLSARDPRLRPRKGTTPAQPKSRGLQIEEDVICLVSDSEDEHAPAAGPSGTATQPLQRPSKDVPSIVMSPVTPEQSVQAQPASHNPRLQPKSAAGPVTAAGVTLSELDAVVRAGRSGADVVSTPAQKKRRTARKSSAAANDAAAAVAHDSAGAEEGAVTEPGQKRARKRRTQANDAHSVDAELVNQTSGPGQERGDPVDMQHSKKYRTGRSRQQQLSFSVHRRAKQGGGPQRKGSHEQAPSKQQASAAPEGAAGRFVHAPAGSPGSGARKVAQHVHGKETSNEQAQCSGMEHEAPVDAFYLKHHGSPRTAEQKGKAQVKDGEESKQRWWADNSDAETSESDLLEDLLDAGIRSKFDKRKIIMPD
ncbi:hypothetical protein COCOBI_02-2210 [Coccomyxa sp. Obi]|nr:hypothetical protein COCOBI_02-2210 [Coccomyxa sp. Obi]